MKTLHAFQASAAEWHTQVTSHMSETDKVIDELKRAIRMEFPRHKLIRKADHDARMADASTTPVPDTPPQSSAPAPGPPPAAPTAPRPGSSSDQPRASSARRPNGPADDADDRYVILRIFPLSVVKSPITKHCQFLLGSVPQRVADDRIFRSPPDGTTFGVRFSTFELSQLYLDKARRYTCVNSVTEDTVHLDATVRKSDERRARGRALHPAYVALTTFGYDRDTMVMKHSDADDCHSTRISLAGSDGSAFRLGFAQDAMRGDGTAAISSFVVDEVACSLKPDIVRKVCESLGLAV